jgi:DNA repair protein RadC
VKDLPLVDRPREKLMRAGATALGDNELVALVLGSGTRERGALAVAHDVLSAAGGADGLPRMALDELRVVEGVGAARAARLIAAVELGRRALVREAGARPRFRTPADVAHYLMPLHGGHRVERFGVLLLDVKQRLIRTAVLSMGTSDATPAQPREVFREALLASASNVVVFHNHPSGDPVPSKEDAAVTTRMVQVGELMGITVMDHIILGAGRYYSFKQGNRLT